MGHYCNQAKLIISTVDCDIARDCWSLVLCLFGVQRVMPQKVIDLLACWKGHFGSHGNGDIWKAILLHLLLTISIWRECRYFSLCNSLGYFVLIFTSLVSITLLFQSKRRENVIDGHLKELNRTEDDFFVVSQDDCIHRSSCLQSVKISWLL